MSSSGNLIIISAPSGSGKTSMAGRVLCEIPDLQFSISHTTRKPRKGERHGVEYFFINEPEFEAMIRRNAFLEHAHVYGHYYGTGRTFVMEELAKGKDVLLDIDVQGAASVQKLMPQAVTIFVLPPSLDVLLERLRGRGLDDEEVIQRRLRTASEEILHYRNYQYVIINRDIEESMRELKSIVWAARCRTGRRQEAAAEIVKTFREKE